MLQEWPICPRPEPEESLPSWIERIGREYGMSAAALVNSIDAPSGLRTHSPAPPTLQRLYESQFVDRLVRLSRLSPPARTALWPPMPGWELRDFTFRAYCPLCCLEDIRAGRTPFGRQCWLQSWCTVCAVHRYPLIARLLSIRDGLVGARIAAGHAVSGSQSVSRPQGRERIRSPMRDARKAVGDRARELRCARGSPSQSTLVGQSGCTRILDRRR